jgi:hypothetical protein
VMRKSKGFLEIGLQWTSLSSKLCPTQIFNVLPIQKWLTTTVQLSKQDKQEKNLRSIRVSLVLQLTYCMPKTLSRLSHNKVRYINSDI